MSSKSSYFHKWNWEIFYKGKLLLCLCYWKMTLPEVLCADSCVDIQRKSAKWPSKSLIFFYTWKRKIYPDRLRGKMGCLMDVLLLTYVSCLQLNHFDVSEVHEKFLHTNFIFHGLWDIKLHSILAWNKLNPSYPWTVET